MKNYIVILCLLIAGCTAPSKNDVSAVVNDPKAFEKYTEDDQAADTKLKEEAVNRSANREQALALEAQASQAVGDKIIQAATDPKTRALPAEQRRSVLLGILQKTNEAKKKMRDSDYKEKFAPNW